MRRISIKLQQLFVYNLANKARKYFSKVYVINKYFGVWKKSKLHNVSLTCIISHDTQFFWRLKQIFHYGKQYFHAKVQSLSKIFSICSQIPTLNSTFFALLEAMFQVANQNSLCGNMFSTKIHFFGVQIHKKSNFHWIFLVLVFLATTVFLIKFFKCFPCHFSSFCLTLCNWWTLL